MKSMNIVKAAVLASVLSLPAILAGNAYAIPSCGACVVGAQPASHTFVTATTDCTTCHTATTTTTTTTSTTNTNNTNTATTGTISVRPTTESCGACQIGTAPSSVSAHKNVNSTGTACYTCHSSGSTSVASDSTGGRTKMKRDSDDGHQTMASGSSSSGSEHGRAGEHRNSRSIRGTED